MAKSKQRSIRIKLSRIPVVSPEEARETLEKKSAKGKIKATSPDIIRFPNSSIMSPEELKAKTKEKLNTVSSIEIQKEMKIYRNIEITVDFNSLSAVLISLAKITTSQNIEVTHNSFNGDTMYYVKFTIEV